MEYAQRESVSEAAALLAKAGITKESLQPAPEAAKKEEAQAKPEAAPAVAATPEREKPTPETTAARERALTALRRAKVPKDVLEGLSDEHLQQWGGELAKDQAKVDKAFRERAAPAAAKQTAPAEEVDGADQLGQMLGLDEAKRKVLGSALSSLQARAQERISDLHDGVIAMMNSAVLANLRVEMPDLADKATRAAVQEQVDRLKETDAYDGIADPIERLETIWRDAASIQLGPTLRARTADMAREQGQQRQAAQPASGKVQNDDSRYAGMDWRYATWVALNEGKTRAEADAIGARIRARG